MKFVFKSPVNNIPVLGQIMAWRRPYDKPLSKPMVVSLLTHICVNRPLWVNMIYLSIFSGSFHWHWAIYDFFPVRMKYSCKNNRPVLNNNNTAKFEPLRWRHNGNDGVSNHQPHHCLLNRLFGCRSKKASKLRVTGLCAGNSPGTGEFPAQMASNAENVSIWWRHHALCILGRMHCFSLLCSVFFLSFVWYDGNISGDYISNQPRLSCVGYY